MFGGVEDVKLQRNLVGTDLPGFKALPNDVGVAVGEDVGLPESPIDVRVGTPGLGNVISGNQRGVMLLERAATSSSRATRSGPATTTGRSGNVARPGSWPGAPVT